MEHTFTQVLTADDPDGFGEDVWQCNDCGAYAQTVEKIKHYDSCIPGDSERWRKYYEENNDS